MNTVTSLNTTNISIETNNIIQFPTTTKHKNPYASKRTNSTVQPIKDKSDIERAKQYFHDMPSRYSSINIRNYCLFVMGINVARRIGDLLKLKIGDIIDKKGNFFNNGWIEITEEKTNKKATFQLHPYVQSAIKEYLNTLENYTRDDYLFSSRKINKDGEYRLDPRSAWRIMNNMSKALELEFNVGTHSLRKTWAYQTIQANKDDPYIVAAVSNELNHSSIGMTYKYSGFDKEVRSHLYMDNVL